MSSKAYRQGLSAEFIFTGRLIQKGYEVVKPVIDDSKYDLIVKKGSKHIRIQVKATSHMNYQSYRFRLVRGSEKKTIYKKSDVDFFALYITPLDLWYIIPIDETENKMAVGINPDNPEHKFSKYKEYWDFAIDFVK